MMAILKITIEESDVAGYCLLTLLMIMTMFAGVLFDFFQLQFKGLERQDLSFAVCNAETR